MQRVAWLALYRSAFLLTVASGELTSLALRKNNCDQPAKCETGTNLTCLGIKLSYSSTSLELVDDVESLQSVDEKLDQWRQALVQVPRCWRLAQPLLCSLYRPPCVNESVPAISYTLCERARTACRITAVRGVQWPPFLSCERDFFRKGCKQTIKGFPSASSTPRECISPLIVTANQNSWYSEIDECGLSCKQHPLLTSEEHSSMRSFVFWITVLSGSCCLLSVLIFLIDWSSLNKFPNVTGFYVSVCLLIVCSGFSVQFLVGPESILCKKDGTIRQGEPNSAEDFACTYVFIACYYFLLAAITWMVLMCYAWTESILHPSSRGGIDESQNAYIHLIGWCVPFVLTLIVLGFSDIEANSLTGICFVGTSSVVLQLVFVVIPCVVAFGCSFFILARLEYRLIKLRSKSYDERQDKSLLDDETLKHINSVIFRLGLLLLFLCLLFLMDVYCHAHEFFHAASWKESLREHFSCRVNVRQNNNEIYNSDVDGCQPKSKPNIGHFRMHLLILFLMCLTKLSVNVQLCATGARISLRLKMRKPEDATRRNDKPNQKNVLADAFARIERAYDSDEDRNVDSVSQTIGSGWSHFFPVTSGFGPSPALFNRRYSSTSDVSRSTSNLARTMARRKKTRKARDRHRVVEKTTSTGDLAGAPYGITSPLIPQLATQLPATNKCLANKKNLINPPFTHGMSGESRNNNLSPFRLKFPTMSPNVPQSPLRSLYSHAPAPPAMAFIPPMYPVIHPYTGYPINPYSPFFMAPHHVMAPHLRNEFVPFPDVDTIKSPLITLRAHETGSESSFRMPAPSDTEYDTEAYRPQTAIPKDSRQPKSGKLTGAPKKKSGFFSS